MKYLLNASLILLIWLIPYVVCSQELTEIDANSSATVKKETTPEKKRFQLGGYGEAVMQRMFYNDNVDRYTYPENRKEGSHGRFDLSHVVISFSYDFGKGWKLNTEIEFEHGGTGTTYEIENAETGEYETEIEKGGEIALEQFWIEKSFAPELNLRKGHIIVPVGLTNQYHLPTEFFSVLRPEEESSLIPCTWHETGISLWGKYSDWRYEIQFLAGLDADRFGNANWISGASVSPYEFKIANSYAGAFRIDNYSIKGLRIGASSYFGNSGNNSLKSDRYKNADITGQVTVGALDAVYDDHNLIVRGNLLYGHLSDSYDISSKNKTLPSASPSPRTDVASDVLSYYLEAGYNILSFFPKVKDERLYIYGHYGYYNSMYKTADKITAKPWCEKTIISGGFNYFPMKEIVIKGEYSFRKFNDPYNNEPTVSLGIGYAGFFL